MNLEETDIRAGFEDRAVMFGSEPDAGALWQAPSGIER
jgi:hypothetical protein